jgi:diguanylate cyclase (GGDEF)-like protein
MVQVSGFAPCACTVRDFCRGGMFIALAPEGMALLSPPYRPLPRDTPLVVELTLREAAEARPYRLRARTARVLEQGIGVAFEEIDEAALLALERHALQSRRGRSADRSAAAGESDQKRGQVLEALRGVVFLHLEGMLLPFFARVEPDLMEAADASPNFVVRGHYLEARTLIREGTERVEAAFARAVLGELPGAPEEGDAGGGAQGAPGMTAEDLSLIDQADFEDMLSTSEIATRAEHRYQPALNDIQRRLAALLGIPPEVANCPVGPGVFADAFRSSLAGLGLHRKALDVVYRVFERASVPTLGTLYEQIAALLKEQGVEPVTLPKFIRRERPGGGAAGPGAGASPEAPAGAGVGGGVPTVGGAWPGGAPPAWAAVPPGAAPPPGGPSPVGPWPVGTPPAWAATPTGAAPALGAVPTPGAPAGPPPAGAGPPSAGGGSGGTVLPWGAVGAGGSPAALALDPAWGVGGPLPDGVAPVAASAEVGPGAGPLSSPERMGVAAPHGVVSPEGGSTGGRSPGVAPAGGEVPVMAMVVPRPASVARNLLGLARWVRAATAPPPVAGQQAEAAEVAPEVPPAEEDLLEALSELQADPTALAVDRPVLERVLERLLARGGGRRAVRLAPGHEAALELVDDLFRAITEDVLVHPAAKQRIGRLALPLHRVAVVDDDFLQDRDHPARRLLDRLDELPPGGPGPAGDPALWSRVDTLVDRVAGDVDLGTGTLEEAIRGLDAIVGEELERYRTRVDAVVRAAELQQNLLISRRRAGGSATRPVPPELAEWVGQAGRLQVGDRVEFGLGTPRPELARLAWVGQDHGAFVFVDRNGGKVANLSRPEVAMQLRRGSARLVQEADLSLVDRALDRVMERVHRRLEREARHDRPTGLLSAPAFEQALESAAVEAARGGVEAALGYLELDRLRVIREVHGLAAVDACLAAAATAIASSLPAGATAGRLPGDAFGVLLPDTGLQAAVSAAGACCAAVQSQTVEWQGERLKLSASAGVAAVSGDTSDPSAMLREAALACEAARKAGQSQVRAYQPDDDQVRRGEDRRQALERLMHALREGHIPLKAQPIAPLVEGSGRLPHFEILLNLQGEDGRPVPAQELIAAAEQYDEARALDRLVVVETLRWIAAHPVELERVGAFAINLSGQSLSDEGMTDYVLEQLMDTGVPPAKLIFEVTETSAVEALSSAQQFMRTLREFGCRFALDDFGSGHVSYAYLKTLPVDFVKIDGLFVRGLPESANDYAVVKSINEIAHVMGKLTVAEYVHNSKVAEALRTIGVDYVQGFWVQRPRALQDPAVLEMAVGPGSDAAPGLPSADLTCRLSATA